MADEGVAVAIVGAAGEVGRDLREVLEDRAFPVSELLLYDEESAILAGGDDEARAIRSVEEIDFSDLDLIFFCSPSSCTEERVELGRDCGATVVDLSQTLATSDEAELIVPEVNSDQVAAAVDEPVFATPLPAATALAVTLAPLENAARLRRVTVTCLEPVSSEEGGVEELARQTGDLLGGREPESRVWPVRIAFNLLPQVGEIGATGATSREWQIQRQLRRVLDLPDLPISAHAVRVPAFYGLGLVVNAETDEPMDTESALDVFRSAPGVLLHEGEHEAASYPTLSDAIGSEATHVGRVREDPTVPCGVSYWSTIDGLRKGTTVNAAQIAECVVRGLRGQRG